MLRSAFVTHLYGEREKGDGKVDERLCASVLVAMKHGAKEARKTYDRRTAADRKKAALAYAYRLANAE